MSIAITDLARSLADRHGVNVIYTAVCLTRYLEQCAAADEVNYDRNNIPDEVAEFIARSFATGLHDNIQRQCALGEIQIAADSYI